MQEKRWVTCPYCWQRLSNLVDWSGGSQRLIQDCEVCCNPIEMAYGIEGSETIWFEAESAQ